MAGEKARVRAGAAETKGAGQGRRDCLPLVARLAGAGVRRGAGRVRRAFRCPALPGDWRQVPAKGGAFQACFLSAASFARSAFNSCASSRVTLNRSQPLSGLARWSAISASRYLICIHNGKALPGCRDGADG